MQLGTAVRKLYPTCCKMVRIVWVAMGLQRKLYFQRTLTTVYSSNLVADLRSLIVAARTAETPHLLYGGMPQRLNRMYVAVFGCANLTDAGVKAIADSLLLGPWEDLWFGV